MPNSPTAPQVILVAGSTPAAKAEEKGPRHEDRAVVKEQATSSISYTRESRRRSPRPCASRPIRWSPPAAWRLFQESEKVGLGTRTFHFHLDIILEDAMIRMSTLEFLRIGTQYALGAIGSGGESGAVETRPRPNAMWSLPSAQTARLST